MKSIMMKNFIAAVVAGVVLFVWGFISWTMLPWRDMDVHEFSDENVVMQTLLENAPSSGIYYIPNNEGDYASDTPNGFINLMKEGFQVDMGEMMLSGFLANVVMALLIVLLLRMTSNLSFKQRVSFVALVGLTIGVAGNAPYWNWFGFPTMYTLIQIVDSVIMWFFAGLVLAKLVPERE